MSLFLTLNTIYTQKCVRFSLHLIQLFCRLRIYELITLSNKIVSPVCCLKQSISDLTKYCQNNQTYIPIFITQPPPLVEKFWSIIILGCLIKDYYYNVKNYEKKEINKKSNILLIMGIIRSSVQDYGDGFIEF